MEDEAGPLPGAPLLKTRSWASPLSRTHKDDLSARTSYLQLPSIFHGPDVIPVQNLSILSEAIIIVIFVIIRINSLN